jgi:hypothetical protein
MHVESCIGDVQCCLHTGYSTANHHNRAHRGP